MAWHAGHPCVQPADVVRQSEKSKEYMLLTKHAYEDELLVLHMNLVGCSKQSRSDEVLTEHEIDANVEPMQ